MLIECYVEATTGDFLKKPLSRFPKNGCLALERVQHDERNPRTLSKIMGKVTNIIEFQNILPPDPQLFTNFKNPQVSCRNLEGRFWKLIVHLQLENMRMTTWIFLKICLLHATSKSNKRKIMRTSMTRKKKNQQFSSSRKIQFLKFCQGLNLVSLSFF